MDEQWAKSLACRVAAGDREAFDELMGSVSDRRKQGRQ